MSDNNFLWKDIESKSINEKFFMELVDQDSVKGLTSAVDIF